MEVPNEVCAPYGSGRLLYPATDLCMGLAFEIIRADGLDWGYLSVFSFAIPCENDQMSTVEVLISGQSYLFLAPRLEGHQRLLLPDEALQLIILELNKGNKVTLSVGNYHTTLMPLDFTSRYTKLIHS